MHGRKGTNYDTPPASPASTTELTVAGVTVTVDDILGCS